MRAVVISEPGRLSVETIPDPAPGPNQVVVAVERCGICGTDRHTVSGDNPFVRFPAVPGHEFAGTIVALGSNVTRLAPGQAVAVDPSYFCGRCDQCRAGFPNLCPFKGGYGSAKPGAIAEFVAVDDTSVAVLPEGMDAAIGALAEPLACVLHGMDNLGPVLGHEVLIYGAGPIGLLAAVLLNRAGAREITVVETAPLRRKAALDFGADVVLEPGDMEDVEARFHVVVDATGSVAAIEDGFSRIRSGGRFLILGVARQDARIQLSPFAINWRELRIIGSMAVRHSFGRAVELLDAGFVDADRLVTTTVSLDGFGPALDHLSDDGQLKIQVDPALTDQGAT